MSECAEGVLAGVAQLVEQLICNQQVAGSSPIASSSRRFIGEGCPSGQWGRAVNPLSYDYEGSNPSPSTILSVGSESAKKDVDENHLHPYGKDS